MNSRASSGKRIKFIKHNELYVSHKVYSDGNKVVRLILDPNKMEYFLSDPVTGHVYLKGGEGLTNFEVLQRNAKKALKKFLGLYFEKEKRNVGKTL